MSVEARIESVIPGYSCKKRTQQADKCAGIIFKEYISEEDKKKLEELMNRGKIPRVEWSKKSITVEESTEPSND